VLKETLTDVIIYYCQSRQGCAGFFCFYANNENSSFEGIPHEKS